MGETTSTPSSPCPKQDYTSWLSNYSYKNSFMRVRVLLYAVALHCGTRYLIAVLARPTAQVPRWAGNVSGGPGSIPGRFWRTGVPSFRRCSTEPLHSGSVKYRWCRSAIALTIALPGPGRGRLKKKTKAKTKTVLYSVTLYNNFYNLSKCALNFPFKLTFRLINTRRNLHNLKFSVSSLNFSSLICALNLILLKTCSEWQKLFEVARTTKSCSQRHKLLKSCRAQ